MKTIFLAIIGVSLSVLLSAQERGVSPVSQEGSKEHETSQTYAVVVGISDYQDEDIPDLRFADKDAEAFAAYLRSPAGGSLDKNHLKVLLNDGATMAQFAIALDWMMEETSEGDQAIIYFSGHGDVEKKTITQPGFLLCWDAPPKVYMAGGAFALPFLQEVVTTLSTQNKVDVLVVTDACRSGKLAGTSVGGSQITGSNLAQQYANETKILSCQPNEYSLEGEQWGGGRGAFSYHLVNGLYGMADGNKDLSVNLMEIGRYLEDHVITEVAPQSQVPMTIGNRMGNLATVSPDMLKQVKDRLNNNMPMLSTTSSRGNEDEILAAVSDTLRAKYMKFKALTAEKIFLTPVEDCANKYFEELMAANELEELHSSMKRNFAAALQDDAQQAINIWLEADASAVICLNKEMDASKITAQLEKAASLLGERHYMYKPLKSRQFLFEGKAAKVHDYEDEELGQKSLLAYRKAAAFEPESPLPWFEMSKVFTTNIVNTDSAFIYAEKATELSPMWILPYADLGKGLVDLKDTLAKDALLAAEKIDSLHPFVINRWGNYYATITHEAEKAIRQFEQFKKSGATLYPCWYDEYNNALMVLKKFDQAEAVLLEAIKEDPTSDDLYGSLARLYSRTQENEKGEQAARKAIELDSTDAANWSHLSYFYDQTERFEEAIQIWQKVIKMDPTNAVYQGNIGLSLANLGRLEEAAEAYLKTIALDPNNNFVYINMAFNYQQLNQLEKAGTAFENAIAIDPSFWLAYAFSGDLDMQLKKWEKAKEKYLKAIELHPEESKLYSQLGLAYLHLPDHEEKAEETLKKALPLPRTTPATYISLAKVSMRKNDTSAAWKYLEDGLEGEFENYEALHEDKDLKPLHADERWKELIEKYFPDKDK